LGCSFTIADATFGGPLDGGRDAGAPRDGGADSGPDAFAPPDASCELGTLENCTRCGETCAWSCTPSGCNDAVAIDVSSTHGCVARSLSGTACWGFNQSYQLGDGTMADSTLPVASPFDDRFIDVCVGGSILGTEFSCALSSAGIVSCWGSNLFGVLGSAEPSDSPVPVPIELVDRAAQLGCGDFHVCARLNNGDIWCWGLQPEGSDDHSVRRVGGFAARAADLSVGDSHACALLETGRVQCWGNNHEGQLGDRTTTGSTTPVTVVGFEAGASMVAAGVGSCAVNVAGEVLCWGGAYGPVPTVVEGVSSPVGLDTGCAALTDGVACWDPGRPIASRVAGTSGPFLRIAWSDVPMFGCAVSETGATLCWGEGHLGTGAMSSAAAVAVPPPRE
jgi:hypothetical protein